MPHPWKRQLLSSLLGFLLSLLALVLSHTPRAQAQFGLSMSQRAADGTRYEVISVPNAVLPSDVDEFRVTTVAGGPLGLGGCTTPGASSGSTTRAIVGADPAVPQMLHPYSDILRTGVLTPNDFTVSFGFAGSGRLTIGTGGGAIDICRDPVGCAGGASDTPICAAMLAEYLRHALPATYRQAAPAESDARRGTFASASASG